MLHAVFSFQFRNPQSKIRIWMGQLFYGWHRISISQAWPRSPPTVQHRLKAKNVLIRSMRKDSLINTNSYLRDSKRREALLAKTVVSSTAIEGVHLDWDELKKSLSISNKDIRFYVSARSSESRRWRHPPSVCIVDLDPLLSLHSTPFFCIPSDYRNPRVAAPLVMPSA